MINTYNGSDLRIAVINQTLKVGDHVTFDQKGLTENGQFVSLSSFKSFLTEHFKYKHLVGEEYYKGWCFYEIVGIN